MNLLYTVQRHSFVYIAIVGTRGNEKLFEYNTIGTTRSAAALCRVILAIRAGINNRSREPALIFRCPDYSNNK